MILGFRAATVGDANSVADVYLRSRKELVACAPLGFEAIAFGSGNEEGRPDTLYEWVR
jgi:hypothetical protein